MALLTDDGKLYTIGANNYGQLGITKEYPEGTLIDITEYIDKITVSDQDRCDILISNLAGNKFDVYVTVKNMENIKNKTFNITYNPSEMSVEDMCIMTFNKETQPQNIPGSYLSITNVENGAISFKYNIDISQKMSGWINGIRFKSLKNSAKELILEVTEEVTEE